MEQCKYIPKISKNSQ